MTKFSIHWQFHYQQNVQILRKSTACK